MIGWLLVCDPPEQTFGQIVEVTQASEGSISTALKFLTTAGWITKRFKPGDRKDHYTVRPGAMIELVRVEHLQQPCEVSVPRCREKRIDHCALLLPFIGWTMRVLYLPAAPAGEHLGSVGGPADDLTDLLERHREHVVQHERQPLGGAEGIEHHQQCQPDRFGEQRVVLGRSAAVLGYDQLGQPVVVRPLGPGLARSQHVNADPAHHGGQPAGEVVDRGRVLARKPQPCLLHRVLGVRPRSEHPGFMATVFLAAGASKLLIPQEKLAKAPGGGWVLDFSAGFVKALGAVEILGAVGLILPALLDIAPVLVPLAALGLGLIMIGAAIVEFRRREFKHVLGNLTYLVLLAFVAWGRFGPESFH